MDDIKKYGQNSIANLGKKIENMGFYYIIKANKPF